MTSNLNQLGLLPELKALAIFNDFSDEEIQSLCQKSQVTVCSHRQSLFLQGDSANFFYIVLNGAFKLTKPSLNGEDIIMHFSPPGDVIAALIMPSKSPVYPVSAISMGPSRCIKLQRDVYLSHWKTNHQLVLRIQNLLTTRMVALQQQKALNKAPLATKVASLLIYLADKQLNNETPNVPIPLTRKEIADSIGSTVESVIRVMSDWSKKGYISTTDQHITILKTSKMVELMSSDS